MRFRLLVSMVGVLCCAGSASASPISWTFTTTLDYATMTYPDRPDWLTPAGIVAGAPVEGTLTINRDAIPGRTDCTIYCSYYMGDLASLTLRIGSSTLSSGYVGGIFGGGTSPGIGFEFNGMSGGGGPVGDLWLFAALDPSLFSGLRTLEPDMLSNFRFHTDSERSIDIGASSIEMHAVPEPGVLAMLAMGFSMGLVRMVRGRFSKL